MSPVPVVPTDAPVATLSSPAVSDSGATKHEKPSEKAPSGSTHVLSGQKPQTSAGYRLNPKKKPYEPVWQTIEQLPPFLACLQDRALYYPQDDPPSLTTDDETTE